MTCRRIESVLDVYLDGDLESAERDALDAHVAACEGCARLLARERAIRAALHSFPLPGPGAGFFDRALAKAREADDGRRTGRRWGIGIGSAAAVGLAAWLFVGLWPGSQEAPSGASLAGVSIAMHEPRTINLVFSSAARLDDATLVVVLPEGIELAGHRGRREVRWRTSLNAGRNVLPLELIAVGDTGGELIARLEHDNKEKTFRVQVNVG